MIVYDPVAGSWPLQEATAVPLAAVTPTDAHKVPALGPAYVKVTVPVGLIEPNAGAGVGVMVAENVTGVLRGAELTAPVTDVVVSAATTT